jgi:hypothetical protein
MPQPMTAMQRLVRILRNILLVAELEEYLEEGLITEREMLRLLSNRAVKPLSSDTGIEGAFL